MTSHIHTGATPSFEPDRPSIGGAQRFMVAITIFVIASLFGMRWWLVGAIESGSQFALPGR